MLWLLASALAAVAVGCLLGLRYYSQEEALELPAPARSLISPLRVKAPEERLVFSAGVTPPPSTPDLLPAGVPAIYGFYELPGVRDSRAPHISWKRAGRPVGTVPADSIRAGDRPGTGTFTLAPPSGSFAAGIYDVELVFPSGKLEASFVVAVNADAILAQVTPREAQVAITQAAMAAGVDARGRPKQAGKTFDGLARIYFVFRFGQAEPGSTVEVKWYGGQEPIESATREVLLPAAEGWAHAWLQAPGPGLPAGNYRAAVNMSRDAVELGQAQFTVTAAQSAPARRRLGPSPPPSTR